MNAAQTDANQQIVVDMLGKFSIQFGNEAYVANDGRTKKVWILIEYLLSNRKSDISQEKLIEILWSDDQECDDPYHALKNLVYRARKLLKEISGDGKTEFIRFARNTYSWNHELPCKVDIEEFEQLWKSASDKSKEPEQRMEQYLQALELYQGEFLPKSATENWVISKSAYFASIFNECVLKVCSLLMDAKRYSDIITVTERAVSLYPFEEAVHKLLIFAYINIGKQSKALTHYEYVLDLFQREMNVDISDSLRSLHKQILNSQNAVETDLAIIKSDLQEACETNGAYYCDYEIFKNIYRLLARSMMRTGQSIHVGLLTLTDQNGDVPDEAVLKGAKEKLKDCIIYSLRKGDAVASYSPAQFVITLPLTTYENGEMVLRRISERFRAAYGSSRVKVSTRINQVDPT